MLDRDAIAAKHILEKDHASSHLGTMEYDGASFFRKKVKLKNNTVIYHLHHFLCNPYSQHMP